MSKATLLTIDGIINLLLGIILIFFPSGLVSFLGIPDTQFKFYPNILGAVLIGIGIALILEKYKHLFKLTGLGLGGAICINLSGGIVLTGWLLIGKLEIPTKGFIILWLLVIGLIGISLIELFNVINSRQDGNTI